MSLRFGFVGFRHGHIYSLFRRIQETDGVVVVAACEEDAPAREEAIGKGVEMTHDRATDLIENAACEVIAIGDYFARRGSLAIAALKAGKHVIVDKPLCTDLGELEEIESLSGAQGLKVGCMLTMRSSGPMNRLRNLIGEGAIGEVHAISFGGQHPLNLGSRADWYFEPGKHGGTITDIGVHAIDMIPWMTGLEFSVINAARCWNAFAPEFPHFEDGGQMMLTMNNGCGVLGDVSYFMPNKGGYASPFYWRTTVFGRKGILETSTGAKAITVAQDGIVEERPFSEVKTGGYFEGFLKDIRGEAEGEDLDTAQVIKVSRTVLRIQKAADEGAREVRLT